MHTVIFRFFFYFSA
ncbi:MULTISPECIES: pheST operon leader peptide PheM [Yersinia pseudotuberculosis complex]|uniref:pheST attenuator peptide n=3 Tax=Yersinia pseudotuberculosis complex TaxID=1649845 RepID=Q7CIU5_YERPE|nr:phenylalanyl-tRNA synthetase (pheST) operon leader peptide [Yersinia pestis KIM10+]ADV98657.1 phenylalanyl-tRNA synthetase operon leader peptide [Yersinia pestis biovar Medievalis str. Harbin 35]EDM42149.1 phenylalanyl-tRNA synthetase operon leader peptide [Yersinia pestis CA88-4125]EEO76789.1 hypothetical protein YP516_2096 [Yersinia pestis Nepal516]EEO80136.1 hypothetical protein YPF_2952 [Yersinia pestis biovar Orientalis str. India 195]EEO84369.1 hypothetical protein YPH_0182 [Yersinia 